MTYNLQRLRGVVVAGGITLALAGCKTSDVTNPSVIDANKFNPNTDGATISLSAQTQFYQALQSTISYSGFLSGELWSGANRPDENNVSRRAFDNTNLDINTNIFTPLSQSIASNENVITALTGAPGSGSDINLARAQMNLGFSMELMAEQMCQGVVLRGPALENSAQLDSAITWFKQAITVASASSDPEGAKVVNASHVGMARAYLQKGDNANAAAQAALVTAPSFAYNVVTIDDASNRSLGNFINDLTVSRIAETPATYRALNDTRVMWKDAGKKTQDNTLELFQQLKYPTYAAPVRIASTLEARYILAEANLKQGSPAAALAIIAERRAAGGQGSYTGGSSVDALLPELMDQRARDFWLESKKLGDWRRNPTAEPYIAPTGSAFYKTAPGPYGNATCFPIPIAEVNGNPNLTS
jgi:hypothetical protein